MASPQCKNGYTKIANEILDHLAKIRIPGCAYQILISVIRKSYGYNLKSAKFKAGELSKMTGLRKQHVLRELAKLEEMGIVEVTKKGYVTKNGYLLEINFCKDYEKWEGNQKGLPEPGNQKGLPEVTKKGYHEHILPIIQKERKKDTSSRSKTLIPNNFEITDQMRVWFGKQEFKYIEINTATDEFIDYWKSTGKMMRDWIATWRNGMRNQEKWRKKDGSPIVNQNIKADDLNPETRYDD